MEFLKDITARQKNKHEVDFLDAALCFFPLLAYTGNRDIEELKLKCLIDKTFLDIEGLIKREMSIDEKIKLLNQIKDFFSTNPETEQRGIAIKNLFEYSFLD